MKFSALLLSTIVAFSLSEGVFANPIDEEFKEPLGLRWQMKLADVKRALQGKHEEAPAEGHANYYLVVDDDELARLLGLKKEYLAADIRSADFYFHDKGSLRAVRLNLADDKSFETLLAELRRRFGPGNKFDKPLAIGFASHEVWESAFFRVDLRNVGDEFGISYDLTITEK